MTTVREEVAVGVREVPRLTREIVDADLALLWDLLSRRDGTVGDGILSDCSRVLAYEAGAVDADAFANVETTRLLLLGGTSTIAYRTPASEIVFHGGSDVHRHYARALLELTSDARPSPPRGNVGPLLGAVVLVVAVPFVGVAVCWGLAQLAV